ncbi:P-loop containing nucleoside triphosphate hydrolase protein [Lasiosphaeria miniovina]|uniref:P-loop containing nucleoside triphosphate hydrolase protein n=1 Tax=Lasiosphaeria miniovina TaxID=1954250 RepID=A0AA40AJA1_9PEZI|nr:P-loop containing nucleoside triphosphate hydrolase protein [Lasiosphaeria miniovina]KAK0716906.1 P-loop containing nucleoside triphosphate hydrolase protein [Lasiosphaeria miniovina]
MSQLGKIDTMQRALDIVNEHVYFSPEATQGWKSNSELPQAREILATENDTKDPPENPVDTPWASKEAYLEAQYEILRREGVEGLRFSVGLYKDAIKNKKVRVKSYLMSRLGPIARVEFSTKRSTYRIKWQQSRRLRPGTIVAISTKDNNFKTICKIATIAQRPYRDGLDQDPPLVDLMWANTEDAVLDPNLELVMVESRNGYFESARHALVGLQHAAQTYSPLDKYLIGNHVHDTPPAFIEEYPWMDFSSLIHRATENGDTLRESMSTFHVLEGGPPGLQGASTLDDSQLEGVHKIVSNELAIVQGPPGTGKTFTSIEAIKVILSTRRKQGGPPIIVAAQTNHALDQILIHCLNNGANILRVGRRTESPMIRPHTVYETRMRCQEVQDKRYRGLVHSHRANIDAIQDLVSGVFGDNLISPSALLDAGIITQDQFSSLYDESMETDVEKGPFALWLGDSLIPARILRDQHPTQQDLDEAEAKREIEFDGDLDNIAEDEEDLDRIRGQLIELAHMWSGREPSHVSRWQRAAARALADNSDLFCIGPDMRGAVYQLLQAKLLEATTPKLTSLLAQNVYLCKQLKASKWARDTNLIDSEGIEVVGCTTTGLTKFRGFLAALMPRSLLIEEAAETREANITSALFPSLQQLILVGDHQQLAPNCDIRWLGEEPYNLNVSLFQRMVNLKMPFVMLKHQRRMKPELSYILKPFYPELQDHPVVQDAANRPDVPGMGGRNCFFFDHEWPEEMNVDMSKLNDQEAHMIVNFFSYLVANSTDASKITILTFYNGQRKHLLSLLRKHDSLIGLHFNVFTVDSYQGEENDIVLLSLVRSPLPGNPFAVGFLEDQRRAVVAISRARLGFFMFGNVDNVLRANQSSFVLWAKIWNGFSEQQRVQPACQASDICDSFTNNGLGIQCQGFDEGAAIVENVAPTVESVSTMLENSTTNVKNVVDSREDGKEDWLIWF